MRAIGLLYLRELRGALRERSLVAYSLLIPLLLYPAMMWLTLTGITFVQGQADGQSARIQLLDLPTEHPELGAALAGNDALEILDPVSTGADPSVLADARARLEAEQLELVVRFDALAEGSGSLEHDFTVEVFFDGSSGRSLEAKERFEQAMAEYRSSWLTREVAALGVPDADWQQLTIEQINEASESEMGAFILGLLAPLTILAMMGLAAMYPAIDAIAGERERSTWETSLTLGITRSQLLLAKYLYVATMAAAAGLLNLLGISLSLAGLMSQLSEGTVAVTIAWSAIPIVILGIVLLALLLAAVMLCVAAFARNFREGQALVTPMYMVVILPALFANQPPETLTLAHAAAPVINVMIVFKQAITAAPRWDFLALTILSSVLAIGACLWVSTRLLRSEALVLGSFTGSAKDLLRTLLKPKPDHE